MNNSKDLSLEINRRSEEYLRIGKRAVRRAREENRRLNIPNAHSHNGTIYYELPDGSVTTTNPFKSKF